MDVIKDEAVLRIKRRSALDTTPLLPAPAELHLSHLAVDGARITVVVVATTHRSAPICPRCGTSADRIHSHYTRMPAELPWHGLAVQLVVTTVATLVSSPLAHNASSPSAYRRAAHGTPALVCRWTGPRPGRGARIPVEQWRRRGQRERTQATLERQGCGRTGFVLLRQRIVRAA
jgi:hypothetical protein